MDYLGNTGKTFRQLEMSYSIQRIPQKRPRRMGIGKVALNRPYPFIVLAILILIAAPVVILRTPTDIFPNINIPVVSVGWTYTGLNPEELEGRLTDTYATDI